MGVPVQLRQGVPRGPSRSVVGGGWYVSWRLTESWLVEPAATCRAGFWETVVPAP
jgi:hypothetical protein